MASVEVLEPSDVLQRSSDGKFSVARIHPDYVEVIPVTFDNVPDYFHWLDRNAERLVDEEPEEFRRIVRLMLKDYESK